MQEQEMEEKQNYLRENILNKGYDANEFVQFLQSKKGEAASDISNESMRDLHLVVQEFIAIHTKENNTNKQSQPLNTQNDSNNNILISSSSIGYCCVASAGIISKYLSKGMVLCSNPNDGFCILFISSCLKNNINVRRRFCAL